MTITLDWASVKSFIQTRNASPQWFIANSQYYICAIDGAVEVSTVIPIEIPASADQIDFETNFKPNGNKSAVLSVSPFGAKTFGSKKLYKREHGIQQTLIAGVNTILFTIPYAWVKILGLEIIGGENLDKIDMFVLDSTAGTYSGYPNYTLNQFGYNVNVEAGSYEEQNSYDADLYQGMQLKISYTSLSAKTIGINFNLNEVK